MRVTKCCCFELRTGCLILLFLFLLGSIYAALSSAGCLPINIISIVIFVIGFVALFKVNEFFAWFNLDHCSYFFYWKYLIRFYFFIFFHFQEKSKWLIPSVVWTVIAPILSFLYLIFSGNYENELHKYQISSIEYSTMMFICFGKLQLILIQSFDIWFIFIYMRKKNMFFY